MGDDLKALFPPTDAGLAARAYRLEWGRAADDDEVRLAGKFLAAQAAALHSRDAAVADFCPTPCSTQLSFCTSIRDDRAGSG